MRKLLCWVFWMFVIAAGYSLPDGTLEAVSKAPEAFLAAILLIGTIGIGVIAWGFDSQYKGKLNSRDGEIDTLKTQLNAKDDRLKIKDEKIAEQTAEIDKLQNQIEKKDKQIEEKDEKLVNLQEKIRESSEVITALRNRIPIFNKQLREKDAEIRNLKYQSEETDFVFEPILSFYNNTLEAIKDEGIKLLAKVREVNKEINPNIKNSPKPCSIEELSKVLDIDREDINELVGELKKLNLVNSFGEGGFPNPYIPRDDHYPLFITEKGRTFLFMHKLKSIKLN